MIMGLNAGLLPGAILIPILMDDLAGWLASGWLRLPATVQEFATRVDESVAAKLALVLPVIAVWGVLRFLRFTYRLAGDELSIRSGVLVQNVRVIPVDRVQQVDLNRTFWQRVFGVSALNIEIAGESDESSVSLSVLSACNAELIRSTLSAAKSTPSPNSDCKPEPAEAAQAEEVYRQPNWRLIGWATIRTTGIVVSSVLYFLLMWRAVETVIVEITDDFDPDAPWKDPFSVGGFIMFWLLFIFPFFAWFIAIVSGITNIGRYWNVRLELVGGKLRLLHGLLTKRSSEVPPGRVQVLTESRSIPRRMVGVVGVTAHNASETSEGNSTYLPAVPAAERREITGLLVPCLNIDAPLRRHPFEARRRAVFRRVAVTTILTVITIVVFSGSPWTLVLILLAVPWGWRAWAVLGYCETNDVVIGRRGVWNEVTNHVRRDRVQSASVKTTWFQRRLGLATLRIHIAQPLGKVDIVDLAATEADRLLYALVVKPSGRQSSAASGPAVDHGSPRP